MPNKVFAPADDPAAISGGRLRSHSLAKGSFCGAKKAVVVLVIIQITDSSQKQYVYLDNGRQMLLECLLLFAHLHQFRLFVLLLF